MAPDASSLRAGLLELLQCPWKRPLGVLGLHLVTAGCDSNDLSESHTAEKRGACGSVRNCGVTAKGSFTSYEQGSQALSPSPPPTSRIPGVLHKVRGQQCDAGLCEEGRGPSVRSVSAGVRTWLRPHGACGR